MVACGWITFRNASTNYFWQLDKALDATHPSLHLQIPDEQGGCRVFYGTPSASCTFKVEEFGKLM